LRGRRAALVAARRRGGSLEVYRPAQPAGRFGASRAGAAVSSVALAA